MTRRGEARRQTKETEVRVRLDLDGSGRAEVKTGIGFFDHMLEALARHAPYDLEVTAVGDLQVDAHHTVEDVGIVLGQALDKALGDKRGIERYGFASVPMDEALARVTVDLSGRSALVFAVPHENLHGKIGTFDTQLVREFLTALTRAGKFNCHVEVPHGANDHHIAEAIFKALGRALRLAVQITGDQVPSTKGVL